MSIIENMYKKRETTTRVIERQRIFLTLVDGIVVSDDQVADLSIICAQINYSFSFFWNSESRESVIVQLR